MMRLSIIVPVYNMVADNRLRYCIESLLNQTIDDYEIIVVDDASTDNSLEVLREYESVNPVRIKVCSSSVNLKQGGAKNIGLLEATGEWLGFVDSDDWIAPNMYERLLNKAYETGADIVGCDYCITNEQSMKLGTQVPSNTMEQSGVLDKNRYKSLILDSGSLVIKIYKRSIFCDNNIRFPENIFYEDNGISNSIMLNARHFEYIPEPLYYYYQHNTSTVHTVSADRLRDRMAAGDMIITEAKRFGFMEDYCEEIEYSYTMLYYINTLFSCMLAMRGRGKYKIISDLRNGIIQSFSKFRENKYYIDRVDKEQKKMIDLHMKSNVLFMLYFELLWGYRDIRKRLRNR